MNIKKKLIKTLKICLFVLIFISVFSLTSYSVDSSRVTRGLKPIFCIKLSLLDGGTCEYRGVGYQIIIWHSMSDKPGYYLVGIEKHYLFNQINILKDEPRIKLEKIKDEPRIN